MCIGANLKALLAFTSCFAILSNTCTLSLDDSNGISDTLLVVNDKLNSTFVHCTCMCACVHVYVSNEHTMDGMMTISVMLSSIPGSSSPLGQVLDCWHQLYQVVYMYTECITMYKCTCTCTYSVHVHVYGSVHVCVSIHTVYTMQVHDKHSDTLERQSKANHQGSHFNCYVK